MRFFLLGIFQVFRRESGKGGWKLGRGCILFFENGCRYEMGMKGLENVWGGLKMWGGWENCDWGWVWWVKVFGLIYFLQGFTGSFFFNEGKFFEILVFLLKMFGRWSFWVFVNFAIFKDFDSIFNDLWIMQNYWNPFFIVPGMDATINRQDFYLRIRLSLYQPTKKGNWPNPLLFRNWNSLEKVNLNLKFSNFPCNLWNFEFESLNILNICIFSRQRMIIPNNFVNLDLLISVLRMQISKM